MTPAPVAVAKNTKTVMAEMSSSLNKTGCNNKIFSPLFILQKTGIQDSADSDKNVLQPADHMLNILSCCRWSQTATGVWRTIDSNQY